jgi:hypothetical protein
MSSFRKTITQEIENKRKGLGASSVKTYTSILFNLFKKLDGKEEDIKFFDNDKPILEFLKDKTPQTRKTILSALFVMTGNDEYRKIMIEDCGVVNKEYKEQKKSVKENENWISVDLIKEKYNERLEQVQLMFSKKAVINAGVVIEFLLLAFLGGVSGIAPRRSMDYTELKTKNYDTKTDNYYSKGILYFNKYKTVEKYGLQTLNLKEKSPVLDKILKTWCKVNHTDYVLYSSNGNKLTSPQITKYLNKIFDRKIITDLLRHIYLTNFYKKQKEQSLKQKQNSKTQLS